MIQVALFLAALPNVFFALDCAQQGSLQYVCSAMSRVPLFWGTIFALRAAFSYVHRDTPGLVTEVVLLGQVLVATVDKSFRASFGALAYVHYAYSALGPAYVLWRLYGADVVASLVTLAYLLPFVVDLLGWAKTAYITKHVEALVLQGHFGRVFLFAP